MPYAIARALLIMYNGYTSGMGLPGNVPTMSDRARGSHFSGAPSATFNVGPSSGAGMSIFGSTPAGELMGAPSDDHLFSPSVAPITRAYAIISGTEKDHMWLPKGTVVQIADFADDDPIKRLPGYSRSVDKAKRAGHNLKRLLCEHCEDDVSEFGYTEQFGVVGVLAEATDIGTKALVAQGGYLVVTIAIENAAEVHIPDVKDRTDYTPWNNIIAPLVEKVPAQVVTLQARCDLPAFKVATVLAPWALGDAVGLQVCIHPQIRFAENTRANRGIFYTDKFVAPRVYTQAKMRPAAAAAAAAAAPATEHP